MLKSIALLLGLMMSGIVSCIAANPVSIPSENLVTNSFDVGKITGLEYPVCSLSLAGNQKKGFYNYAEGEICPVAGECTTYSAIMKLDGRLTILKRISSDSEASVFKNDDVTIITTYDFIKGENEHENVDAVIIIKTKNGEKKVNMSGYCGD